MATFTFMFLVNDRLEQLEQLHERWNYSARDARIFIFSAFFLLNLKPSFTDDIMALRVPDVFIENANKMI